MTEPQRREQPKRHLDAHEVAVERALLARADVLETRLSEQAASLDRTAAIADQTIAAEFRALADELHYW